jgi:hypothetical protein
LSLSKIDYEGAICNRISDEEFYSVVDSLKVGPLYGMPALEAKENLQDQYKQLCTNKVLVQSGMPINYNLDGSLSEVIPDGSIEAVITHQGVCLKLYVGAVEVSINLEAENHSEYKPGKLLGKRFGAIENDLAIFSNPEKLYHRLMSDNITPEFMKDGQLFLYSATTQDLFDVILFAQLKAKQLEKNKKEAV